MGQFSSQLSKISETLGLDIQGPVSSCLGLENCSYPSISLGLEHHEFPSLGLEIETDFSESQSRKLRLTLKSLGLSLEN